MDKDYTVCIVREELLDGFQSFIEIDDGNGNTAYIPIEQSNQFIADLTIELERFEPKISIGLR